MRIRLTPLLDTFLAIFGSLAIGRVIRFVYVVVLARALSPDDVGLFTYGMALYLALLLFGSYGQNVVLARRLAGGRRVVRRYALASLVVRAGATLIVAAIGTGIVGFEEPDRTKLVAVLFMLGAMVSRSLAYWVREIFVAVGRAAWIVKVELLFRGSELAIGSAMVIGLGAGIRAVCVLHMVMWTIEAAVVLSFAARQLQLFRMPRFHLGLLRRVVAEASPAVVSLAFLHLTLQIEPVLLRLYGVSHAQVGYFALALQFYGTVLILPMALSQALLPALRRAERNARADDIAALGTLIKLALALGTLTGIASTALGPGILALLLDPRYAPLADIFVRLSWFLGPYTVALLAAYSLNTFGRSKSATMLGLLMLLLLVMVLVIFVRSAPLGAATAALALSATAGMAAGLLYLRFLLRETAERWALALGLWAVSVALLYAFPDPVVAGLLFVSTAPGFYYLGFSAAERQTLRNRLVARRAPHPSY